MPSMLVPLTKEQLECRYKEIGITEDDLNKSTEILTEWYRQQPHFPKKYGAPLMLKAILMGCKNNIEKAKQKIEGVFYYRSLYPNYFIPRPINNLESDLIKRLPIILPKCTPDGYRVGVFRPEYESMSNPALDLTVPVMLLEYGLKEDVTFGGGVTILCDLKYVNASMIFRLVLLTKYVRIISKLIMVKVRKIYLINVGKLAKKGINIVKSLLNEKLKNQIQIISNEDIDTLYEEIPKDILPADYGGLEESYEAIREKYYQIILDMHDWFKDMENLSKSEEVKRSVKQNTIHDVSSGSEGPSSFMNFD